VLSPTFSSLEASEYTVDQAINSELGNYIYHLRDIVILVSVCATCLICAGICRPAAHSIPGDKRKECNQRRAGVCDDGGRDKITSGPCCVGGGRPTIQHQD